MSTAAARPLAWGLAGLSFALIALWLAMVVAYHREVGSANTVFDASSALVAVAYPAVGVLIAVRGSGNRVGWLMIAIGLSFALSCVAHAYTERGPLTGPHAPLAGQWADWLGTWAWVPGWLFLVTLLLLLFPDGHPPSPRWRPAIAATFASAGMMIVGFWLDPDPGSRPTYHNPTATQATAGIASVLELGAFAVGIAAAVVCLAGLVTRFRRSGGEQRQQMKWFAYAGIVTVVLLPANTVLATTAVLQVLGFVDVILLPAAIGIAVFRYRLYDIDVVISKTIVYGCLAAFITVVYVVIVAGLGALGSGSLHAGSRPNPGLSIVATAVVAVAFQPLRERLRRVANRVVYGKRATPYEALSDFAGQVGGTYATDDVLPRMARILAEATGAARADVWLRAGPQLGVGASWPSDAPRPGPVALAGDGPPPGSSGPRPDGGAPPSGDGALTLVRHQGEVLGALSVAKRPGEPLTPAEDKLIADLAGQVGLMLRNVGLTEQLGERLAELRASRRRIVTAQDDQRRRIERDLRDGAQRQLAGLASGLARAQSLAGRDQEEERALVAQLRAGARGALESLRDLARGIYPPLLADQGLAAAVSAHAGKAPLPVVVDADGVGRYPADAETAVYFCCVEAVQNAARHAPGATVRVRLRGSAGDVWFEVADDGPGFDRSAAPPGTGGGLQHMADRLAALGGSLQVDTGPGAGTTVTGQIPVAPVTAPPGPGVPGPAGGAAASSPRPVAPSPPEPAPA